MSRHLEELIITYKSCSVYVAVLHLGHIGELTGEENVLRNHWDLKLKARKFKFMLLIK